MAKIYLASSWRNYAQQILVYLLREMGHEVYDFKNPEAGNEGFHWSEVGPAWKNWTPETYINMLENPIAKEGFKADLKAMNWAEACVLLMPSGRSAALEAGWFIGAGKPVFVYIPENMEPELMLKLAQTNANGHGGIFASPESLLVALEKWTASHEKV